MTFPNALSDLLIAAPSLSRAPSAFVASARSLPARSTSESLPTVSSRVEDEAPAEPAKASSGIAGRMILSSTSVCALDDVAFIAVDATERALAPRAIRASISAYERAAHGVRPSTYAPRSGCVRTRKEAEAEAEAEADAEALASISSPSPRPPPPPPPLPSRSRTRSLCISIIVTSTLACARFGFARSASAMRSNMARHALGTMPSSSSASRTSGGPTMLYDLPLPVWPYAKRHTLYPAHAFSRTSRPRSSNTVAWVANAGAFASNGFRSWDQYERSNVNVVSWPVLGLVMVVSRPRMRRTHAEPIWDSRELNGRHRTATRTFPPARVSRGVGARGGVGRGVSARAVVAASEVRARDAPRAGSRLEREGWAPRSARTRRETLGGECVNAPEASPPSRDIPVGSRGATRARPARAARRGLRHPARADGGR